MQGSIARLQRFSTLVMSRKGQWNASPVHGQQLDVATACADHCCPWVLHVRRTTDAMAFRLKGGGRDSLANVEGKKKTAEFSDKITQRTKIVACPGKHRGKERSSPQCWPSEASEWAVGCLQAEYPSPWCTPMAHSRCSLFPSHTRPAHTLGIKLEHLSISNLCTGGLRRQRKSPEILLFIGTTHIGQ